MKAAFAWVEKSEKHDLTVRIEEYTFYQLGSECMILRFSRPLLGMTEVHGRFADAFFTEDERYLVLKDPYFVALVDMETEAAFHHMRPDPWWVGRIEIEDGQLSGNYYQLEPKRVEKVMTPIALTDVPTLWQPGLGGIENGRMGTAHEPFINFLLQNEKE